MELSKSFSNIRVLVIGDVMLDRYWWGSVSRISPEAPVPVVSLDSTSMAPGGAANVAANIAGLGATPHLIGITGDDDESGHLPAALNGVGIISFDLFPVAGRKTTVKTRIIAHHQQMARIDQESIEHISHEVAQPILEKIRARIAECEVVVISDYGKGFLTNAVLSDLIEAARSLKKPVLVDPKGKDYSKYSGATMLTPNKRETADACGVELHADDLIENARERLLEGLGLDALLITQGEEGMTLLRSDGGLKRLEATARNVFDVTGAGDTVIATLSTALGAGYDLEMATHLANVAAGHVVEQVGTTSITLADLRRELARTQEG